ncbi:hypothetical protein NON20_24250 (plasmid) [Synechocystis sp. B12]|nr:hypothetical protein NON20_24250 [Synechocystis sp. B12]
MAVASYELDREVFSLLNDGVSTLDDWQGAASGIADYVSAWGLERFWSMSRSPVLLNGELPSHDQGDKDKQKRFFPGGGSGSVMPGVGV